MYCRACGAPNDENAWKCVKCGELLRPATPPRLPATQSIPNYLAPAILVTVFCCLPFGIPAIVFASQVNAKASSGDIQGAIESSNKAKMWMWISFGCGLAVVALYALVILVAAVAEQH